MAMADHIDNTANSNLGVYSEEEEAFLKAVERYKRANRRPFPSWCEVLAVLKALGWRKVAEAGPPPKYKSGKGDRRDG